MRQKQRPKGGPLQSFDLVPGSVVEQVSKIQEMTVSLTDDHSEHFVQLQRWFADLSLILGCAVRPFLIRLQNTVPDPITRYA